MAVGLLKRKETHFVLWRPRKLHPVPRLAIGKFQTGNPPALTARHDFDLKPSALGADLWEIPASDCSLVDGEVYHYWFEVSDSNPAKNPQHRILCTDPTAWAVDWRLLASKLPPPAKFTL
jgi:hypothetical protein